MNLDILKSCFRRKPRCCHLRWPEGSAYDELLGVVSWGDYVAMDEATSTADIASDDWETDLIARARGDQVEDNDDSSGDEGGIEEAAAPAAISTKVALGHVGQLVSFALLANDASMVDAVTKLQNIVQEHSIKQAAVAKQKSIRDFFAAKWLNLWTFYLGGGI